MLPDEQVMKYVSEMLDREVTFEEYFGAKAELLKIDLDRIDAENLLSAAALSMHHVRRIVGIIESAKARAQLFELAEEDEP